MLLPALRRRYPHAGLHGFLARDLVAPVLTAGILQARDPHALDGAAALHLRPVEREDLIQYRVHGSPL